MRLAVLTSHPIQYHAPLFRAMAKQFDLHVFFAHQSSSAEQARAGFGTHFDWDVDLTAGYSNSFLTNVARRAGTDRFAGCNTPEIGRYLHAGSFQALLVMGWHLKAYLQGVFAAKRCGIPVMVRGDSHLATPRSRVKRGFKAIAYPPFLRLFAAACYVGQRSRAYYLHYGYPAERLFFSPHCVDAEWFAARATQAARRRLRSECGISPDATVLLFVGKLLPFKRPLDLVFAAARCRERGLEVEVMVAGSGSLDRELTLTAKSKGIPLHRLGFRNQTEMPAAYAAADCLVLPSDKETWGLVANEAIACGRPIIVSEACGCTPDLALDGHVGRSFPTGDCEALADAVVRLAASPPSLVKIGAVSRAYSIGPAVAGISCAVDYLSARAHR